MREINVGDVIFGENNLGLIAGPCVVENRDHSLKMSGAKKTYADNTLACK